MRTLYWQSCSHLGRQGLRALLEACPVPCREHVAGTHFPLLFWALGRVGFCVSSFRCVAIRALGALG